MPPEKHDYKITGKPNSDYMLLNTIIQSNIISRTQLRKCFRKNHNKGLEGGKKEVHTSYR
jgi:hypothetical protein